MIDTSTQSLRALLARLNDQLSSAEKALKNIELLSRNCSSVPALREVIHQAQAEHQIRSNNYEVGYSAALRMLEKLAINQAARH